MTSSAAAPGRTSPLLLGDLFRTSIAAVAALQAGWLWLSIDRGWYLQADLSNLADAVGHRPGWSYLSQPLGGHFGPIMRAIYWLLQAVAPMNYELTIAVRVALQTATVLLLALLLVRMIGRQPIIPLVLALYCFSSLTLPGLTFMTTGLGFGIGQLLSVLAMLMLLRFARTGRVRDGLGVGVLIALATLSSDLYIIYAAVLAVMTMGLLYQGTLRQRLHRVLSHWKGWLAMALPIGAVAATALLSADTTGAGGMRLGDGWALLRSEWLRAVGPALIGGPWTWFGDTDTYSAFYAPNDATILLGQLAFVSLLILGWHQTGPRSLLAWCLPLITVLGAMLLVGAARYGQSQLLIAITPRYSFVVALPLAMAICLSLAAPDRAEMPTAPDAAELPPRAVSRLGGSRREAIVVLGVVGAVLIAACVSSVRYTRFWAHNPGRSYAATLASGVRAAGPRVNLYDTPVPPALISSVEPHHHVSDLLRLLGVPAQFDQPESEPLVATSDGRLVKAGFIVAASAADKPVPNCGTHLKGAGPFTIALSRPVREGEWFLRLELYEQAPSTIDVHIVDRDGSILAPTNGPTLTLPRLAALNVRLPAMEPASVVVATRSTSIDVCLVRVLIGGPLPAPER
ncbi:MAG: hypothetical protein QOK10_3784 [Pseudonocardiales bacterium]|jgi:hypothetical protein|nr:hypothetical protein [Pseudonocardiales bacterium]